MPAPSCEDEKTSAASAKTVVKGHMLTDRAKEQGTLSHQ